MKNCVFCDLVKNGDNNNEKEKNIILYEDELILITQATGSPVRGYLMIITKRHVNGFAELSRNELKHVERIICIIKNFYKKYFNINSILLEHGSTENGRHPQSIVHETYVPAYFLAFESEDFSFLPRQVVFQKVSEISFTYKTYSC